MFQRRKEPRMNAFMGHLLIYALITLSKRATEWRDTQFFSEVHLKSHRKILEN